MRTKEVEKEKVASGSRKLRGLFPIVAERRIPEKKKKSFAGAYRSSK